MLIAWTTLGSRAEAEMLARGIIERNLAACVQIEGPVQSIFRWEGRLESSEEFRLMIKFVASQSGPLEAHIKAHHPYETPEWIVVRSEYVAEKYLSWAVAVSTSSTL